MAIAVMLNNLLHDFAVALLLASLLGIRIVARAASGADAARRLYRAFSRLAGGCVVALVAFGAVRTWGYREYEWLPAAGRGQVAALAAKHVVLGALTLLGLVGWWRVRRRFRS